MADGLYAEEVAHAEGDLSFNASDMSMAEAELNYGECVIHNAHYEPKPARKGKVLDGSCDFDPELFRDDDGSLPEWLHEFLAENPQAAGAAVGFTARVLGGSWRSWEEKPQCGRTIGSWS